jgi:AcrR family transcriptional regulator
LPSPAKTSAQRQRARSPADKDLRRAQLITAATQLFADSDFEAVTISRVAERAGVAKGTAYLYFSTKETLFLELVRQALAQWLVDLSHRLGRVRSAQAVPLIIAKSLAEKRDLRRLLVLLHSVIEPHIDEATAYSFKVFLRDLLGDVSRLIVRKIPGLTPATASTLVLQTHALVISLTQLAEPPAVIAKLMAQDPSLQPMQIEFEPFLAQTLTTLVRGMLYNK